ncbi:MAG: dienelactone hydrolase family protein [Lautropia sp.]|nr:dienelactone hydrolase family protein [Lautropia sp.]
MSMTLEVSELESGKNADASVIVLHGLGADGTDFVPIAQELKLDPVGEVRFVFPHAPVMPVTINGGMSMRAWYDILGTEFTRVEDERGLRGSQAMVQTLIDREIERGIEPRRIVLAGFSQGCAMTLMTGLRYGQRLAGLVGLSGYLPLSAVTEAERHRANHDVPIFLAHGSADQVIPIGRATASRDALKAMGHDVEWHEYPMPHSVCGQEVADLNRWLLRILG